MALWWLACTAPGGEGAGGDPSGGPDSGPHAGGQVVRVPQVVTEAVPPADEERAAWLFENDILHTIDILLSDASYDALDAHPFEYALADVVIDGLPVDEVGVRLRGAIGSFREIWDKPKFKIEFDWHVDGRDFYGLEELALNNSVADCSYLKEAVAYEVFELAGVDRPRLSFARVTLNGADYGLYQVVESVDENFLADRRVDPNGNLYDGKYIWYGGWSYTLLDFDAAVDDQFKLEEGVDVGHVDIHAVTDAVAAGQYTPQWHALTDPVVDWDQWHAVLAVEELIGHNDGYALNQNNYRVYFDPVDGKAEMLPWDLDNTFLEDVWWGMNWAAPRGKLAAPCWADPTCAGAQADAAAELLNALPTFDYAAFVEDLHVLTYDAAMSDPKLPWCAAYVAVNRQAIVDWLDQRPSDLVAHWDL